MAIVVIPYIPPTPQPPIRSDCYAQVETFEFGNRGYKCLTLEEAEAIRGSKNDFQKALDQAAQDKIAFAFIWIVLGFMFLHILIKWVNKITRERP